MTLAESRSLFRSLVWICHVTLVVAIALWLLVPPPHRPWPIVLFALLIAPLLIATRGMYSDRRYTYQWLSLVLVICIGAGIVEVVASQRTASAAVVVMLAALAELLILPTLIRNAPSSQRE